MGNRNSSIRAVYAEGAPAVLSAHPLTTAGLGCDGIRFSITAATQPSVEDVLLGAIPGLPKVHLHNPVLAYEVGDDFMKFFYDAEEGKLEPFVLVVEGHRTRISSGGYWPPFGHRPGNREHDHHQ